MSDRLFWIELNKMSGPYLYRKGTAKNRLQHTKDHAHHSGISYHDMDIEMKRMRDQGATFAAIGKRFGISGGRVSQRLLYFNRMNSTLDRI